MEVTSRCGKVGSGECFFRLRAWQLVRSWFTRFPSTLILLWQLDGIWLLAADLLLRFPYSIMTMLSVGVSWSSQQMIHWHFFIHPFSEVPLAMVYTTTVQRKVCSQSLLYCFPLMGTHLILTSS